jgi:hypothetical protein
MPARLNHLTLKNIAVAGFTVLFYLNQEIGFPRSAKSGKAALSSF